MMRGQSQLCKKTNVHPFEEYKSKNKRSCSRFCAFADRRAKDHGKEGNPTTVSVSSPSFWSTIQPQPQFKRSKTFPEIRLRKREEYKTRTYRLRWLVNMPGNEHTCRLPGSSFLYDYRLRESSASPPSCSLTSIRYTIGNAWGVFIIP